MTQRRLTLALSLLLVALGSKALYAAAAHVQSKACFQASSAATCAFDSNTTAGNVIAGYVEWNSTTTTLNSVTGCSNTYTLRNNPTTGASHRAAMFSAENISGGACTVTANMSASQDVYIIIHEVSGVLTSGAFDGSAMNYQAIPGSGTDAVTSTSITTTADGDYIFAATKGGPFTVTSSAGTGYTNRQSGSNGLRSEDRIQTSAGSIAGTFTVAETGTVEMITGVMGFKASGGGGGGGTTPGVIGGGFLGPGRIN